MSTPKEMRNQLLAKTMIGKLERRHFEAYYCPTIDGAVATAVSLIPVYSSVSWGGSVSIRDSGLTKAIHAGNFTAIDSDLGKNPEEVAKLHRQGLLADVFLTSTNAMTEDGILVKIDGTGNRLAAICFGPRNVIIFTSLSKVVKDLDAAVARARGIAAPINSMRIPGNTPCKITGVCNNCTSEECICNEILITRNCRPAGRIKVVLVGEDMGF